VSITKYLQDAPYVAVDTEGYPYHYCLGISTSIDRVTEYFPVGHVAGDNISQTQFSELKDGLQGVNCLIFHNAKHDLQALAKAGIPYDGPFVDTMLMTHMIDENIYSKALDYLGKKYLDETKKPFFWSGDPDIDRMYHPNTVEEYARHDAYMAEKLFYKLKPEYEQQFDDKLWDWEQKWTRLVGKIEQNGILVDQNFCQEQLDYGLNIMGDIKETLGFNPSSPKELGQFFLEDMGMQPVKKTKKNKPSFDKYALEVYDELLQLSGDPRADLVLTYRGWQKTTSSNYKPYLELRHGDGRLHPNFKIHGTKTGRLSCEHPNLQQIPRESEKKWNGALKKAFIVESGRTAWELDYSQLEFRLAAAYAGEERLLEIFRDPNRDLFSEMAKDLGLNRFQTKTLNYTMMYGGGVDRVSTVFGVSVPAAKAIINNYYGKYPGLRKISKLAEERARDRGYVKFWTGRRRHFQWPEQEARKAFNSAIQGGAFEIVKRAMIIGDEAGLNNDECRIDLQVHDSIRLDIEEGKESIYVPEWQHVMENVIQFPQVKFKVEAKKWAV